MNNNLTLPKSCFVRACSWTIKTKIIRSVRFYLTFKTANKIQVVTKLMIWEAKEIWTMTSSMTGKFSLMSDGLRSCFDLASKDTSDVTFCESWWKMRASKHRVTLSLFSFWRNCCKFILFCDTWYEKWVVNTLYRWNKLWYHCMEWQVLKIPMKTLVRVFSGEALFY